MVSLSPGGGDADVVREFDLTTGSFVAGGFEVPLSKNSVDWIDEDTLLVGYAHGGTSETRSGYQRRMTEWRRGTPLASARLLAEAEVSDIGIYAGELSNADSRCPMISRTLGYFDQRRRVRRPDGQWIELDVPVSADMVGLVGNRLVMRIEEKLGTFQPGTLIDYDFAALLDGRTVAPRLVFAPSATQAVESSATTDNHLWIKLLDNVSGKLIALTPTATGWSQRPIPLAANSTVALLPTADKQDLVFVTVESMLSPTSLASVGANGAVTQVQALPPQFDASNMRVEQRFATSKDGTRVPYFLARRKDVRGPVNVLVHAYGGFQAAQTPTYLTGQPYRSGPLGLFLVEDGNAYVLANIRGGGEYGPSWHRGALREKRQNSFDDLEAVARDLITTGVARKDGVAISGRSNGGVLVGATMTQHPDLYAATIVGSPLFDMQRYSKLSAGASWIDEYGDPDKAADWAFMRRYSPYQNVRAGVRYPPMFLYLSTQDDRVHPGHARKMAAKLKAGGNRVYYHEYLEGGHSVGADREEDAVRAALEWAFLTKELRPTAQPTGSSMGERGR
ncbi:prolyl oligopeptidase family serine peptidase [Sphingomonas lutea]|uniref:prolyl oligopeptidase family serine peptidase n=1 Tax=Sphingomonas lutea TaxID=1045317 RepID=UPI001F30F805|nr:prolyl oligopeptidase family serine peptidase [Sphingomonas lutea]